MPSFRSGLRNVYHVEEENEKGLRDFESEGRKDFRRRGSSLPAHCNSVSVKIMPSLRHSLTNPDIFEKRDIPKDVIETDYLIQSCDEVDRNVEEETSGSSNQTPTTGACQTEVIDTRLDSEACNDLRKAIVDGLDHRMISGRRNNSNNYKLMLNADLLDRVSLDIVRISQKEPSGLSGCRLRTRIERLHSTDMDLGCLRVDQGTEETFEIVLSLKECQQSTSPSASPSVKRRPSLRNASSLLSAIFNRSQGQRSQGPVPVTVYVGEGYQLEKIKLHGFAEGHCANVGICNA